MCIRDRPCTGCFVTPVGLDAACAFQPPECGIKGGLLQLQQAACGSLHGFVDFIAIAVVFQQLGQNDRIGVPADHIGHFEHFLTLSLIHIYAHRTG